MSQYPGISNNATSKATYVTTSSEASLPNSRVLTAGTNVTLSTAVPGEISINATGGGGGGGNVTGPVASVVGNVPIYGNTDGTFIDVSSLNLTDTSASLTASNPSAAVNVAIENTDLTGYTSFTQTVSDGVNPSPYVYTWGIDPTRNYSYILSNSSTIGVNDIMWYDQDTGNMIINTGLEMHYDIFMEGNNVQGANYIGFEAAGGGNVTGVLTTNTTDVAITSSSTDANINLIPTGTGKVLVNSVLSVAGNSILNGTNLQLGSINYAVPTSAPGGTTYLSKDALNNLSWGTVTATLGTITGSGNTLTSAAGSAFTLQVTGSQEIHLNTGSGQSVVCSGGLQVTGTTTLSTSGINISGDIRFTGVGRSFRLNNSGGLASARTTGTGTLSSGTVTITNTASGGTLNYNVVITPLGAGTWLGTPIVDKAIGSFTVTSTNALDNGSFDWFIYFVA